MQQLSARYVRGASFTDIFEALLPDLLTVTDSSMGFIAHLGHDDQGPLLQAVAHSTQNWQATAPSAVFTDLGQGHLVFRDFDTLFGQVITTGQTLITNDVPNDPRAKGTPPGHAPLHQFLGIPLHHGGTLVGMLALANRPTGYDMALVDDLRAVVSVLANIVGAIDLER
ncbi:MAG TPA: GAF domain-containing protein, partial [Aquabacterium sp.]|nr:GAF domain-containing protein [Aquabacterium sp.]